MQAKRFLFFLVLASFVLTSAGLAQNRSIRIRDGEKVRGRQTTLNGSVIVGEEAEVRGNCSSVNGTVEIGYKSQVRDLSAVNGRITVREEVIVDGDISTVNGDIVTYEGVDVQGRIESVNGKIRLEKTNVRRSIHTVNGDVRLRMNTVVRGDIIVKETHGWSTNRRRLRIEIQDGSVVEGDIIVEDDDIEVKVYLSKGGKVKGRVIGAELIDRE